MTLQKRKPEQQTTKISHLATSFEWLVCQTLLQSMCSITIFFVALHISTLLCTLNLVHLLLYVVTLQQCFVDPGNLAWSLSDLNGLFNMTVNTNKVQTGPYYLLCGVRFAYRCWLLSARLSCFVMPAVKLMFTLFFCLKTWSLTILKIHSALL